MISANSRYWLCQFIGWGLVVTSVLLFARAYHISISKTVLFGRISIVFVGGILTTHILRLFIKWRGWMMQSVEKVIPKLAIATVIISILFSLLVLGGIELFHLDIENQEKQRFITRLLGSTVNNGLLILAWVLIYYFYHFIEKSRRQQLDTLQLESLIKELELKTIKAHINPHFIFNSLNSIRALIDENPSRARTAVTELSNILRSSMQADKSETVSFEKELNIVKDYLALENMRFEDRLTVEYVIDEDTLDQQVPPMMLQTLVENAIKHGISKHIRGGVIRIISDFKNHYHELAVQNTGSLNGGMNAEGFGLSSTQNRLGLLYGDKASFEIKQVTPSTVEAKVLIPVQMN
ncbi:MAG TPA: histidine kinase [Chitinophagaceae bacterium]|nr:histidine kinase [Chitinophagaceae bacterium]